MSDSSNLDNADSDDNLRTAVNVAAFEAELWDGKTVLSNDARCALARAMGKEIADMHRNAAASTDGTVRHWISAFAGTMPSRRGDSRRGGRFNSMPMTTMLTR